MKETESSGTWDIALLHPADHRKVRCVLESILLIVLNLEFSHQLIMIYQSWPVAAAVPITCSFVNKFKNRYVTNHIPKSPIHKKRLSKPRGKNLLSGLRKNVKRKRNDWVQTDRQGERQTKRKHTPRYVAFWKPTFYLGWTGEQSSSLCVVLIEATTDVHKLKKKTPGKLC